jgi:hypothetical protein
MTTSPQRITLSPGSDLLYTPGFLVAGDADVPPQAQERTENVPECPSNKPLTSACVGINQVHYE